jgi:hypothetical protein
LHVFRLLVRGSTVVLGKQSFDCICRGLLLLSCLWCINLQHACARIVFYGYGSLDIRYTWKN